MHLYKLVSLVAAFAAVSAATTELGKDLQAGETNVGHTRQKRAPFLLKKFLIGGLLAKKAALLGGGLGLAGVGLGAIVGHKLSQGNRGYPVYYNQGPSGPNHAGGPPVYFDQSPPAHPVRPPVYYDQYPPTNSGGHYGAPVYPSYPGPLPSPPSYGPDCYTGPSSYNQAYNSARASGFN